MSIADDPTAIGPRPFDDCVLDYVGGKQDFEQRLIRAVGDASERFDEDKLLGDLDKLEKQADDEQIVERVRDGKFAYLGSGDQLLNNIYVGNLAGAVLLALEQPFETMTAEGLALNLTDPRLVTKREFIGSIAEGVGLKPPSKQVPLPVARGVAWLLETVWRLRKKQTAPLLSQARIKFLGLNLDFSSERARRCLGYDPPTDFADAIKTTMKAQADALS